MSTSAANVNTVDNNKQIYDSPVLAYSDDSSDESSETSSLPPCPSIQSCLKKITHHTRRRKDPFRVTFGLEFNKVQLIHMYEDTWLTRMEMKLLRSSILQQMEEQRLFFNSYLQAVDAAFMHVVNSVENQSSPDEQDDALLDALTKSLILLGSNGGFRGLEHASGDAKQRRLGRSLGVTSVIAKYHLLLASKASPSSIPAQLRRHAGPLNCRSVLWARYVGMVDAAAALEEYVMIPRLLSLKRGSPVVDVPPRRPTSKMIHRLLPLLDHNGHRYHRLDNGNVASKGSVRKRSKKKSTTLFHLFIQRWRTQEGVIDLSTMVHHSLPPRNSQATEAASSIRRL
jgi:hypothetical protein